FFSSVKRKKCQKREAHLGYHRYRTGNCKTNKVLWGAPFLSRKGACFFPSLKKACQKAAQRV
ncbi:MAG: hypothetical protein IJA71_02625, partial [Clostridia bacterium]|nr:hypothetical protein [Clostridia bacterium]